MKIAVCIKMVPNSDQVKIDPVTHNLIRENTELIVNPSDLNALTEAMHVKEMTQGTIDVFTMGSKEAEGGLYTAMAIGADRAFLVSDRAFAGGDSIGTARVLAAAIKKVDTYDLIICGALSADGATGQVGPMIAEELQIPSVSLIKAVENADDHKVVVAKSFRGKKMFLSCNLPCLLSTGLGVNNPILPTLRNQMKAKKKEIGVLTNSELNLDTAIIGKAGALSVVTDTYEYERAGSHSQMLEGDSTSVAAQIKKLMDDALEMG